jgi:hypothetical protein
VTARRSRASSLTSLPAEQFSFGSRDKHDFRFSYFRGMYSRKPNFLGAGCFSKSFVLFVLFERKYRLSSGLVLYLRPQFDSPGSLSSGVFCMTTRKDPPALIDTVLAFELWVLILELSITGQQCLHAPRIKGIDSSHLPHSSRICYFDPRVADPNPSNYLLAGNTLLLFKSWLSIL